MFSLTRHFRNALQPLVCCALDLAPAARVAWLDELRADCPTVARAVERLMPLAVDASPGVAMLGTSGGVVPGSPEHLGLRH